MSFYPLAGGLGWDIAGTEEYDMESAFNKRVQCFNARQESNRKRAIYCNSKANRLAYGVESANARFTVYGQGDEILYPDHCKRVARVLAQAAFLPMHVEIALPVGP